MVGTRSGRIRMLPAVAALLVAAAPALAQEPRTTPPVELNIGIDGVASIFGDGHDYRLAVSLPKGERLAFEFFGGVYEDARTTRSGESWFGGSYDTRGIYGFQIKQRILRGRRPNLEPFVTYGAMGVFARVDDLDCTVGRGCRPIRPTKVLPPALGLLGAGFQYAMLPHLSLRFDVQGGFVFVIPVGMRVAAAVAIPLGRVSPK